MSDPVIAVASAAVTRSDYLLRPDLGRALAADAAADLAPHAGHYDVAFVVADGLSARAVQTHAPPVLAGVIEKLRASSPRSSSSTLIWRIAPLVIVRHGRVAISDAIANALGADCVAVLIGERPGLSAADSMGAYLTFKPQAGTTDADRNCISNIRPEGLGYADAAFKIAAMLRAMRAAGSPVSGSRTIRGGCSTGRANRSLRHCERKRSNPERLARKLDCFVASLLAMTSF